MASRSDVSVAGRMAGGWMFTRGEGTAYSAAIINTACIRFPSRKSMRPAAALWMSLRSRLWTPSWESRRLPRSPQEKHSKGFFVGAVFRNLSWIKMKRRHRLWLRERRNLIIKEDLRDLSHIRMLSQVEELVELLVLLGRGSAFLPRSPGRFTGSCEDPSANGSTNSSACISFI